MTRRTWLGLVIGLTAAALAATFFFDPFAPRVGPVVGPAPTPLGWAAQLEWLAGDGIGGDRDGLPQAARFADPYGVAVAGDGTVYVADGGDNNRIRRIGRDGQVATLAGSVEGFRDGAGTAAAFHTPSGLALDRAGNLYVADTGNHAIRRITPQGIVSTLAGTGVAGYRDGPAAQAQFNGPIGVAVDSQGRVHVADTYNDRIRVITPEGNVSTLAGGDYPGFVDGTGVAARFDTPTALAVDRQDVLWVADLRNNAIRHVNADGVVGTARTWWPDGATGIGRPLALAITRDGVLYVSEMSGGRILQIAADGHIRVITGHARQERLSRPAGLALDGRQSLIATDATGYRVHRIAPRTATPPPLIAGPAPHAPLPQTQGRWPLAPQQGWHEVVGTLGEVRGNFRNENRDHLHSGLDIRGDIGQPVLAIADGKVASPHAAWGFGGQGEGMGLDTLAYIHMRVGRTARGEVTDPRFQLLRDEAGEPERIRVRRGTRFAAGDVLGTINPMAHVHLSVGGSGYERNAIALGFTGYADSQPPRIDGIHLLDTLDQPLAEKERGHVVVPRELSGVRIVVEAWDQVDRNLPRRRLGLYALGYQILDATGRPLPGYESPRMNIEFNRMPPDPDAVMVAYAADSGITVHGSAVTRFQYVVTNRVRDGVVETGSWQPSELPAGEYLIRITALDYSGNAAGARRDLKILLR
nr:gluconolaconase [Pseudoxanthomonas sp.]